MMKRSSGRNFLRTCPSQKCKMIPEDDLAISSKHEHQFGVYSKSAKRSPWKLDTITDGLERAFDCVAEHSGYRIGIMVLSDDHSGTIYWTSRDPELYNSPVLQDRWRMLALTSPRSCRTGEL